MTGHLLDKAVAYLAAGRVVVMACSQGRSADVLVKGSGADPYAVQWTEAGGWTCTCPARVAACSHVLAAALVIDPAGSAVAEARAETVAPRT